jgi:methylmalonyl-CoA mutase N-terminal domain/subunit
MEKEKKIASGQRKVVGVNCYEMEEEPYNVTVFRSPQVYGEVKARQDKLLQERDAEKAKEALDEFRRACQGKENVMPPLMKAVKVGVTAGEVGRVQREVYGIWKVPLPI